MSYKIFVSFIFVFLTTFICTQKKQPLTKFELPLPRADTIAGRVCIVKYKNSLYDNNLALKFKLKIVYLKSSIADWIIRDTGPENDVIVNNLNNAFAPQGISFVVVKSNIEVSDNTIDNFFTNYKDYKEDEVITIVVYEKRDGVIFNGIAASAPSTIIAVVEDRIATSTVPHEMGHAFGLNHIFDRDETDGYNAYTGDKICDTPYFNIMDNKTSDCNYVGPSKYTDKELSIIIPNYLNYSNEKIDCRDRFTPIQILSMRWYIENYPQLYDALVE